jgi:hypothetical protein
MEDSESTAAATRSCVTAAALSRSRERMELDIRGIMVARGVYNRGRK